MCKFNNRLFVFALYSPIVLVCALANPVHESMRNSADNLGALVALSTLMNSQDVHYDQRQKGEENYRIKLDSFFIGLPQEESTALLLLTDDIFENLDDEKLLSYGKNKPAAAALTSSSSPASPNVNVANQNSSANADMDAHNVPPMIVEIPASKRVFEARNNVDSISRTKSYISHFLNLMKRARKH